MVLTLNSMEKEQKENKRIPKTGQDPRIQVEVEVEVSPPANHQKTMRVKVEEAPAKQVRVETITPHPPGRPKLLGLPTPPAHPRTTLGAPKEGGQDPLPTDARTIQTKSLLVNSVYASWEVTLTVQVVTRAIILLS